MIGYKNTISGGSSIMQPIRIPENTRNVIILMNLIISSTACSRKSSQPVVKDIFTGIFQLIQLRNLGTKYWVYGVARNLGFGENSVWSSTPRLGEGLSNMLEG